MASFDSILKKGKSSVIETSDREKDWRTIIGVILGEIQKLNEMYGDNTKHHIFIHAVNCLLCNKSTYLIDTKEIDSKEETLYTFRLSDWSVDGSSYKCPDCIKKGK